MTPGDEPSEARRRAEEEVASGRWPHPNERPCHDCDHVWFSGERAHAYDVEQLDGLPDDPQQLDVVCVLCRRQRSFERAEDTSGEWRKHW
jgi:hypothetical protein